MHRDTKIGLAMAIVLVGFAAALCFPRESRRELTALTLPDSAEVDARIEQSAVKVYTQAEHPDLIDRRLSPPIPPATQPQLASASADSSMDVFDDHPTNPGYDPATTLDPILAHRSPGPFAPVVLERGDAASGAANMAWTPGDFASAGLSDPLPTPLAVQAVDAESSAVQPQCLHTVQAGDTLSGLALRYLGSVARYPDIFEANRNLLETPDDLRLGMQLRIPPR
ncbi:MAG: LysM peptidoglycan-binding domain-containing protein [Planctomycetaceae bacterium]